MPLQCHSGQFREPFQNIHGLNPQNTAASQNGIPITDLLKNVNIQATADNFGLTDLGTEEQLRARFLPGAGGMVSQTTLHKNTRPPLTTCPAAARRVPDLCDGVQEPCHEIV
jgi:hypothetical protein